MVGLSGNKIFSIIKWIVGHAFLVFMFLFFVSLTIGGIMFYRYGIVALQAEPEPEGVSVRFQENVYQEILKEWQIREKRFEVADHKEIPELFWIDRDDILSYNNQPNHMSL